MVSPCCFQCGCTFKRDAQSLNKTMNSIKLSYTPTYSNTPCQCLNIDIKNSLLLPHRKLEIFTITGRAVATEDYSFLIYKFMLKINILKVNLDFF